MGSSYELRQFVANTAGGVSTVALTSANRGMIFYAETGNEVRNPTVTLFNGEKYNVNGTWPADLVMGNSRAVYSCRGANQQAANQEAATLIAINGRSGVLTGVEYTASGVATHTVSAIVLAARPTALIDRIGAWAGRQHEVNVELVFDRLNNWS